MPITGPSSYVPTTTEFISHWTVADTQLGAGNEVVLADGTTVANLQTKLDSLVAKRADLQAKINLRETARGTLDAKKKEMHDWLVRFNELVRADFEGSKWDEALPNVPSETDGQGPYSIAFDDAESLWTQMNADPEIPQDLTLLGGYDLATFSTDVVALKGVFTAFIDALKIEDITRGERGAIEKEIYAFLKAYRKKLPTKFAQDDPIATSLPRLTPLPGSTPDGVVATGEYDEIAALAKITWTPSSDPNISHYEIRWVAGPVYSTEDESISGSVQPGDPLEFFTVDGLSGPGAVASYKVYVVLTTGNEKGSNAVSVTQPMP